MSTPYPKGRESFLEAQDKRTQKRLTREWAERGYQSPVESTPDDAPAYLAMAAEEVACAIRHMEASTDTFGRRVALDALHDALTAIEAEMEAISDAQP